MKTKIKSVTVIGGNYFREYKVGDTVNGLEVKSIEVILDEFGFFYQGYADIHRSEVIFSLINLPVAVHYEEERERAKNPCPKCGEDWNQDKTDECEYCGNSIPF